MKKIIALVLCALMIVAALCGCSKTQTKDNDKSDITSSSKTMQTVLNTAEYTLYQNIFYNDTKADYNGKPAKKEGVFTTVIDSYNNTVRYYVWGYND
ncbi:MAG: hypothetical protein IKR97_06410, partial [Eubacterium sp.]|nr:hypothetical protein [Eubacterium sp.]